MARTLNDVMWARPPEWGVVQSSFKDVAGAFVQPASVPTQLRHLIDRAMRICSAEPLVACIILPNDLQELDVVEVPRGTHGTTHSGVGYQHPLVIPRQSQIEQAAAVHIAELAVACLRRT